MKDFKKDEASYVLRVLRGHGFGVVSVCFLSLLYGHMFVARVVNYHTFHCFIVMSVARDQKLCNYYTLFHF